MSGSSRGNQPIKARGMSKALALLLLFPLALIEFVLVVYMLAHGIHSVGLAVFLFSLWNLGACFGLTFYIFSHKYVQSQGYMEVSNYANLNRIGRDKL